MSGLFQDLPTTPRKNGGRATGKRRLIDDNPSTTPAGPPPPSATSFLSGNSNSNSGTGGSDSKPFLFGAKSTADSTKNLFGTGAGSEARRLGGVGSTKQFTASPLGRSLAPGVRTMLPSSGLAYGLTAAAGAKRKSPAAAAQGSFEVPDEHGEGEEDGEGAYEDEDEHRDKDRDGEAYEEGDNYEDREDEYEDGEGEEDDYYEDEEEIDEDGPRDDESIHAAMEKIIDSDLAANANDDDDDQNEDDDDDDDDYDDDDLFLNLPAAKPPVLFSSPGRSSAMDFADSSDLMLLNTPAATERMRQEAEDIFRATAHLSINAGKDAGFKCASIAKTLYRDMGFAIITETPELIIRTEDLLNRTYQQGVGTDDDAAKLDETLASVVAELCKLWRDYCGELPPPTDSAQAGGIGPGPDADPFETAAFVGHLVLRMHHSRFKTSPTQSSTPPLPETLFAWQQAYHNPYPSQVSDVLAHAPSPACHGLFWQTLRSALVRGDVRSTHDLLERAGWEHQRKSVREPAYSGRALENVRQAAAWTCEMLRNCPGTRGDWDIWGDGWNLFRVQAEGSLNKLKLFAEGDERATLPSRSGPSTMAGLARKADSQIPWDVYENLQTVYEIVLGMQSAIFETAQDWCEATVGLMGWWDQGRPRQQKSLRMSKAQSMRVSSLLDAPKNYDERLALAVHTVFDGEFQLDGSNPVEVAVASVFEDNVAAVVGFLRAWSLPVACAVAEIASLGQWLPRAQAPNRMLGVDGLDVDDLEVLGMTQQGPDEVDGVKDTTMIQYARELAGVDQLSNKLDGWEMAIQVLGRMDSAEKSENTIGELLQDLMSGFGPDSGTTVEKVWRILYDLGLLNFAEDTAEAYADILSKQTKRYGEALWYYALAHHQDKVREVLSLLMAYCLVQSTAYPPADELDTHLRKLLSERSSTLEAYARQDVEAGQLLGRMLSGYATLRRYYEIRDSIDWDKTSPAKWLSQRRRAATALVAVISSADDNIRGGLHDPDRDSVVSEDFLLALLGEATVFVSPPSKLSSHHKRHRHDGVPIITLDQVDTLLKAIEDLETVGSRVYRVCAEFFASALKSTPGGGARGSKPSDLMASFDGGGSSSSSYVLAGSSMLASRAHQELVGVRRGWDWRAEVLASDDGADVLRKLRVGLAGELARLWVGEADQSLY